MIPASVRSRITLHCSEPMQPELGLEAMRRTIRECGPFVDAIFVVHDGRYGTPGVSTVVDEDIAKGTAHDYTDAYIKSLFRDVRSEFALLIQWDGWAIDANAWDDAFLDYDYIGSPWPWHRDGMQVGCGGFSMMSRRMMDVLEDLGELPPPGDNGDNWMCRTIRPRLERDYGIRYAPTELAARFSYERHTPNAPTFGFHGLFNMWRHVDDAEMIGMADRFAGYLLNRPEYLEILFHYFRQRRFPPLRALYRRLRAAHRVYDIQSLLTAIVDDDVVCAECIAVCEALIRT